MKESPNRKKAQNGMSRKLTVGLLITAGVLLIALIAMLIFVSTRGEEQPVETVPPTTAPAATQAPTEEPTEAPTETVPPETEPVMLPRMAELYEKNNDIAGWVRIDGTNVDYPFVYTPEEPDKYLYMNVDGKKDYAGAIVMDQNCTVDPESSNIILYGHHMKNGTMFKSLMWYASEKFWKEHPTIYFSNLYEEREYEIIAVLEDRIYKKTEDVFKFYYFINPETEEEFNEGITYFKNNSLYDTGLTAEYGDRLLMLVTCAYHVNNGRFVVVAREITDHPSELPAVDSVG